jgi:hypothetical protein
VTYPLADFFLLSGCGFDLFVGIKKFTDVTRNLHCDVGDIFGSRFAVLIKRYGLLNSGDSGKGCGERINFTLLEL